MTEFNNRIAAQRDILEVVNSQLWREELFGLSNGAIERWVSKNNLEKTSRLVELVRLAATKLFFLSNKSQEQITEEYRALSADVQSLLQGIRDCVSQQVLKTG